MLIGRSAVFLPERPIDILCFSFLLCFFLEADRDLRALYEAVHPRNSRQSFALETLKLTGIRSTNNMR